MHYSFALEKDERMDALVTFPLKRRRKLRDSCA
jgi:hypothetical protein